MIGKINRIIKYQVLKEFPDALIIIDKKDNDYRIIVDKNTYFNNKFKILVNNIKINILLENKISNVFIVSVKKSDFINKFFNKN